MGLKEKLSRILRSWWFTGLLLILGALGVGYLSLAFAAADNRWNMMSSYFKRPLLILLNMLPCVLLTLLLWFLTNRPLAAYLGMAVPLFGLTMGNWFKLQFRNDPLLFGDLLLLKEAGTMLGRYSLFLTPFLAASLFVLTAWAAAVGLLGKWRFPTPKKKLGWLRFALAGVLLALCIPLSSLYTSSSLYNSIVNNDFINRWSATQVYTSKGFLYPFLHSVPAAFPTPPEGYSREKAAAVLEKYSSADIPEEKKVNVIAIMLEAFNDLSKYDQISLTRDVYGPYHRLEEESIRGDLITSIFAAGTVDTERAFLTGYSAQGSYRAKTNSFAWYMADQGYAVTGSHPSMAWFYNRMNINLSLGFDSYLFKEDHYGELAEPGTTARDYILMPELNRLYEEHVQNSDQPYFSFSVTYQGHGPYSTEENIWEEDSVTPGLYSKASETILNNYFGSVGSTSESISKFVDFYRDRQEPVVIVLFGDHNPWLGDDNSVYKELNIDLDISEKTGFLNYYGTRYLIWANDAAKACLGNEFRGEGPTLSPNFLMSYVFDQCGWEGPEFMQYQREVREQLPVLQSGVRCMNSAGDLLVDPSGPEGELKLQCRQVEYYMRTEFRYRDLARQRESLSAGTS